MLRKLLLILLVSCLPLLAAATHILGGEITYKYEGASGGQSQYSLYINIYRDCSSKTPFDDSIDVGVYKVSSTTQDLYKVVTMYSPVITSIQPYNNKNTICAKLTPTCIEKGAYSGRVSLPDNVSGYKILFGRCCRTGNLINVADTQGQAYSAFIPNTALRNSSPGFLTLPANYIKINAANTISNTAVDTADGDSLVYSLALPAKLGDAINPRVYPASIYKQPLAVIYKPGYSYTKPFGTGSSVSIDPVSGLTHITAKKTGPYVLAIDIKEYRNGVLISTTRRDIVYFAVTAPPSPAIIQQNNAIYTSADSLKVEGGLPLIFRTQFKSDTDSVYMKTGGELFFSSRSNKPTIKDSAGISSANSKFAWTPACSDIRSQPYTVSIHVYNNACPPTDSFFVKRIYVVPFRGAKEINGPNPVCHGNVARYYVKGGRKGYSYIWSVISGRILNYSLFSDSIQVDWGNNTSGSITLYQANSAGCAGDTLHINVKILPSPVTPGIVGPTFVCPNAIDTYTIGKYTAGSTYSWKVKGGSIITTTVKTAVIAWGLNDTGEVKLAETNASGCTGDSVTLAILKNVPRADSLAGSNSVCPNSKGIDYFIARNITPGSTFIWKISGGVKASGANTDHITVNWGNKGFGKVQVVESTKYGCKGDTLSIKVNKEYAITTSPIIGDSVLCEYSAGKKYSVHFTHNSTYTWSISGGNFTTANGVSTQYANWGKAGSALIMVKQTAYDSVNNLPCISKDVVLPVTLNPLPTTGKINGDSILCAGKVYTFNTSGLPGSSFIWTYNDGPPQIFSQGNDTIQLIPKNPGNFILSVRELTLDSCTGNPVFINLLVNPSPATGEIQGPKIVCAPDFNNISYSVSGNPNSIYTWKATGGIVRPGAVTGTSVVDWKKPGYDTLYVTETNTFGCSGGIKKLVVEFDSAEINMIIAGTQRQDENIIELKWSLKNAQFLRGHLEVERRSTGAKTFESIDTVSKSALYYVDSKAGPGKHAYDYNISGLNNCGSRVSATPHRTILLSGNTIDSFINLRWNAYRGWAGIKQYVLFTNNEDDTSLTINKYTTDTFAKVISTLNGSQQCFRVAAINGEDSSLISYSNRTCFDFEPIVFVPGIFTPDGNELNDKFRVFAGNWKAFDFHIYDRWGEEIFASSNPSLQWDGTFKGVKCAEGTYIYILNVQGRHTTVRKKGTIVLTR
jgi:gliding motility-associated-like protein